VPFEAAVEPHESVPAPEEPEEEPFVAPVEPDGPFATAEEATMAFEIPEEPAVEPVEAHEPFAPPEELVEQEHEPTHEQDLEQEHEPEPARESEPPSPPTLPRPRGSSSRVIRSGAPAGGGQLGLPVTSPGVSRRSGRSILARLGALVALIAVVAAGVILVAKALQGKHETKAPTGPVAIKVLIPEGRTRVQIAETAKRSGLKGSYLVASRHSALLDPAHYGAPKGTPDLEGFLFPATYDMFPGDPAKRLVEKQLEAFRENFGSAEISDAKALHVTPYKLLIVASMVEREAQVPGDREKIAAVIYNRLKAGMPLGIDASIYYAVELEKGIATYTHELSEADLRINSPYNTRTHKGLPPTPISNPGVASIQAAAHPAHVSYLYYVAGADGCGEQVFSNTQAAFEVNVAAYQAAVNKNGGHPPSCKHK
jgi:cell division protein YceG involved in septum cleavage